ncbi:hypothetical protein INN71_06725 [Nocardioides sp. ChNu-153]|uniref:hypothetical protein n=1 Tax=unclassified Nocardioides TaxID=2615069 RepID=UPI00240625A0|nr:MULTISPECIES: hypothetical protein [unclassified Nocardioides]MDF9715139.1 hypothetical protein [Nocardioides sp. ChNu-99]MDN7121082.1 hypothetical protein [Nocardioides sp. ChNu-153]
MRVRFHGEIAGVGSTSGVRVVVGRWVRSPYGEVADAMVETADGHRVLVAPSQDLADFIAATYTFDEVRVEPVELVATDGTRRFTSPSLRLEIEVGRPTLLGRLVALVPRRIATSPLWCAVTDPVARVLLRGVRTRGSAGGGRREWYGAHGVRAVTAVRGSFDGVDLGALRPVDPPARFGFSSTPPRPSITSVVTTIDLPDGG